MRKLVWIFFFSVFFPFYPVFAQESTTDVGVSETAPQAVVAVDIHDFVLKMTGWVDQMEKFLFYKGRSLAEKNLLAEKLDARLDRIQNSIASILREDEAHSEDIDAIDDLLGALREDLSEGAEVQADRSRQLQELEEILSRLAAEDTESPKSVRSVRLYDLEKAGEIIDKLDDTEGFTSDADEMKEEQITVLRDGLEYLEVEWDKGGENSEEVFYILQDMIDVFTDILFSREGFYNPEKEEALQEGVELALKEISKIHPKSYRMLKLNAILRKLENDLVFVGRSPQKRENDIRRLNQRLDKMQKQLSLPPRAISEKFENVKEFHLTLDKIQRRLKMVPRSKEQREKSLDELHALLNLIEKNAAFKDAKSVKENEERLVILNQILDTMNEDLIFPPDTNPEKQQQINDLKNLSSSVWGLMTQPTASFNVHKFLELYENSRTTLAEMRSLSRALCLNEEHEYPILSEKRRIKALAALQAIYDEYEEFFSQYSYENLGM